MLKNKKTIWTQNANSDYWKKKSKFVGDVGRIYGVQWRDFNGVDQVKNLINGIKKDPDGRRHILSAWNPSEIELMSLPPCHAFSQFFISVRSISRKSLSKSIIGLPFS